MNDLFRVFIVTECNEPGVPQVVCFGPVSVCNLRDQLRLQPSVVFHCLAGQSFTPPRVARFRQISEWTRVASQSRKSGCDFALHTRCKPVSNLCDEQESLTIVIAYSQILEAIFTRSVTANYQFLPFINPDLHPCAASFS